MLAQRATRLFDGGTGLAIAASSPRLVPLVARARARAGADLLAPQLLAIGLASRASRSVIPYSLETEALRRMPANVFGVLMSIEPALAALAGFIVLGQDLGGRELVAIALVVAASIGVTRGAVGAPRPEAAIDA